MVIDHSPAQTWHPPPCGSNLLTVAKLAKKTLILKSGTHKKVPPLPLQKSGGTFFV